MQSAMSILAAAVALRETTELGQTGM